MPIEVLPALDRSTLRERCTGFVRERIVSGAMPPGTHIREAPLSGELGVSRGTLREALRPLETEGLLVSDGRGHMLVRELSAREILEVFEVRQALEALAASELAERDDRATIVAELRGLLVPLRSGELGFGKQIELDLRFHAHLCELTGNLTLVATWRRLIGQIEMIIIAAGPGRAVDRMRYADHIAIVDAIETGDSAHAAAVVSAHMNDFARKYVGDAHADGLETR